MPVRADPIIVARENMKAELAVQMAELSNAQRITLLDLLSVELTQMAEELGMEAEADE